MEYTAFNWDTFATLHGINCIQSRCMDSTSFTWDAFHNAASDPVHSIMLHGIHCIQSGSIGPRCMESTALNLDAWNPLLNWYQLHNSAGNPLHSIGIHCHMLHGFHCIQPGYTAPGCMQSTAFTLDAFHTASLNPLH